MRPLTDLPPDSAVFVDANLLAYFYVRKDELAQAIARFLGRGAERDIQMFTSTSVVADVIHRVMVFEAIKSHGLEPARAVSYLKQHPVFVQSLREHLSVPSELHNRFNLDILPVTHVEVHGSRRIRAKYGLMTNDSLIVAVMRRNKITHLATNDRDFERVNEIQAWSP